MWTLRKLTADAIRVPTGPLRRLFPPPRHRHPVHGPAGGQPWRIQVSAGSGFSGADSAGGWCWQSHQEPPGQSS
jgi:hypothetical protein